VRVPEVLRSRVVRALILRVAATLGAVAVAGVTHGQQKPGQAELHSLLARIAGRVEQYFARAQSIVCEEVVTIQYLSRDLTSQLTSGRRLDYELRVAWDAATDGQAPEATTQRQLLKVDGHVPKPKDEPRCMDPENISPEPLAFLLSAKQADYLFTPSGVRRLDGRPVVTLDARLRAPGKTEVKQKMDDCWSFEAPARTTLRVWVDTETSDVRRMDQTIGRVELNLPPNPKKRDGPNSAIIEHFDWSIRYKPVLFHEPDETVILPDSIEIMQLDRVEHAKTVRITHRFSNYRRFLTGGRLIKERASAAAGTR
jgi:hypothetical protein